MMSLNFKTRLIKALILLFVFTCESCAYANDFQTCKALLSPAAANNENYFMTWSGVQASESSIERVGIENIILSNNQKGDVNKIEILLPSGDIHLIKVITSGTTIVEEKITEELVYASGIADLPIDVIKNFKTLRFQYLRGSGQVWPIFPRRIDLDIRNFRNETLAHELGHVTHFHTTWFYFKWGRAIRRDGNSVSQYGDTWRVEDFAESVVAYLEPDDVLRAEYRSRFPNRFALLDEIFKGEHHTRFSTIQRVFIGPNPYFGAIVFVSGVQLTGLLGTALYILLTN